MFRKKFFKYLRSFGLLAGCKLFFQVRRSKNTGTIQFGIPGLKHPVYIRRGSSDFAVFEEIFIDGHYEGLLGKNAAAVIDAGANIGLTALFLLRYYPNARIVCIEPEPKNYAILLKNTERYQNVTCLHKALWCNPANLQIRDLKTANWAFEVIETADENGSLPAVTIGDILATYNLPTVDILKMDIEGSEKEVFETGAKWINQVKYLMVEIHEDMRKGSYQSVMTLMKQNGFSYTVNGPLYLFFK
jgi:FkbM family methyltransferase